MRFQLDLTITEEDYLAFNYFHVLESSFGKKRIILARLRYIALTVLLVVLVLLFSRGRIDPSLYVIVLSAYTTLYMLLYKSLVKRSIRASIKRVKKEGKPSFDPISKLEFYDDKLVAIDSTKRIEQGYDGIEGVHIVEDRYIFLYDGHSSCFILPIPQVKAQLNQEEFIDFLFKKCSKVEYYCK